MAKRRKTAANRDATPRRLMLALVLTTVGLVGGSVLGNLVVGGGLSGMANDPQSFAALSANPDAVAPDAAAQSACIGCADSYGVGARMRAMRDDRMDASFRELGVVQLDAGLADPDGDYEYGGRYPDPEPIPMTSPVALAPSAPAVATEAPEPVATLPVATEPTEQPPRP